ncbi:ABC transporter ATP-binding protein [Acetobacter ascendens]|uniref:ABC transporter ATP-binding protein n=1 Tax=Acetobacter ascendens TaxID=481146 RepID=UPI000875A97D|nr:ABC transporter ATP-binding protein [Acetobacter ascendens]AOW50187.1 ABC transporter ATP-binding protein [Acetobacter ascendens]
MEAYSAGPLLELNKAVPSFEDSGLPPVSFSMKLMPGECMIVEARDPSRATMFADLCSGMVELESGQVSFMGLDWANLQDRELNALRGRIGRITRRASWAEFMPTHLGIILQQLHHTTRSLDDLVAEAVRRSESFGLPGVPTVSPSLLSDTDLTRVSCVRAFMGQPHLLLLEDPLEGGPPELYNSFFSSVTEARDRGAGVIWLVRSNAVWQSYRQGITSTWRLADDGLVAVRMA